MLRFCGGMTPVNIACNSEPCALIPTPQKIIPINAKMAPPRNTNGAAAAEMMNASNEIFAPNRSNKRPNGIDASALLAIATA